MCSSILQQKEEEFGAEDFCSRKKNLELKQSSVFQQKEQEFGAGAVEHFTTGRRN
jgi:hypothetical protein